MTVWYDPVVQLEVKLVSQYGVIDVVKCCMGIGVTCVLNLSQPSNVMVYDFQDVMHSIRYSNNMCVALCFVLYIESRIYRISIMILYKHYGYLEKHNTKHHTIIIIVIIISELIMRGMLSNVGHPCTSRRMKSAQPDLHE